MTKVQSWDTSSTLTCAGGCLGATAGCHTGYHMLCLVVNIWNHSFLLLTALSPCLCICLPSNTSDKGRAAGRGERDSGVGCSWLYSNGGELIALVKTKGTLKCDSSEPPGVACLVTKVYPRPSVTACGPSGCPVHGPKQKNVFILWIFSQ